MALSPKDARFVEEYLIDLNAARAARAAGFSETTARAKAFAWAQPDGPKPDVYKAILARMNKRAEKTEITADRVIQELAKVGFASMRQFIRVDEDGQPQIDLTDAPEDALDALAEVSTETVLEHEGSGDARTATHVRKTKIKLHDKLKALMALGEHTGAFKQGKEDTANAFAAAFLQLVNAGSKAPISKGAHAGDAPASPSGPPIR